MSVYPSSSRFPSKIDPSRKLVVDTEIEKSLQTKALRYCHICAELLQTAHHLTLLRAFDGEKRTISHMTQHPKIMGIAKKTLQSPAFKHATQGLGKSHL